MRMKKKYAMTLLEVMIVIFIIGIIGSIVGYNMIGSLDNGRAFKTREGSRKLYEIVQLEMAEANALNYRDNVSEAVFDMLKRSGLAKNVKDLMRDGWGNDYRFVLENGQLRFYSEKYHAYCAKKGIQPEYPWEGENELSHS